MTYQAGDHVYADLPRRVLCRVLDAESISVRGGAVQLLKLEPLEGPWRRGTPIVRRAEMVVPVPIRDLWRRHAPVRSLVRQSA